MRLLCAAALALSFGLWVAFAEDKKPTDPKTVRAARLAELKKKYDETFKELSERFAKAAQNEKRGIVAEMREEALLIVGKVIKVAEDDPKDAIGFEASAFIVETAGNNRTGGPDVEKAIGFIAEHHLNNAKLKDLLAPAMQIGPDGTKLLKAASEKSTDKDTKATALLLRGYIITQNLEDEEDDKKVSAMVREATELLESAVKLSPNAKVGETTLGKFATTQLDELKLVSALGVGLPAPKVESKTLEDKKATLEDHKGKVVLLDIWATWCGPCKAMIPHERALVKKLKGKPFVLVSVSADDEKKTLQKFLEKEEMPWVHWWDNGPESAVLKTYRVRAFPTLYLIDHAGIIRHKWLGAPEEKDLDKAIEDLVKIAEKSKG
jgi:thiol-disulfide isomerase/thioredoxin